LGWFGNYDSYDLASLTLLSHGPPVRTPCATEEGCLLICGLALSFGRILQYPTIDSSVLPGHRYSHYLYPIPTTATSFSSPRRIYILPISQCPKRRYISGPLHTDDHYYPWRGNIQHNAVYFLPRLSAILPSYILFWNPFNCSKLHNVAAVSVPYDAPLRSGNQIFHFHARHGCTFSIWACFRPSKCDLVGDCELQYLGI